MMRVIYVAKEGGTILDTYSSFRPIKGDYMFVRGLAYEVVSVGYVHESDLRTEYVKAVVERRVI